jgi:uncharacterized protein YndB with AHSA1/START domain
MTEEKDGPVVVRQIRIDATPAAVYSLLTDARLMTAWFAEDVVAEPFSGGAFRIPEPGGRVIEGKYLEVVPNRKVVFILGRHRRPQARRNHSRHHSRTRWRRHAGDVTAPRPSPAGV